MVNERVAHLTDEQAADETFRTVIIKQCGGREKSDMLFSSFANAQGVAGTNVEMIGKDSATGAFNYYELLGDG